MQQYEYDIICRFVASYRVLQNIILLLISVQPTSLVAWWSEPLTTNYEVLGSISGSTVGNFPCSGRSP
jgi:hypothetical protein